MVVIESMESKNKDDVGLKLGSDETILAVIYWQEGSIIYNGHIKLGFHLANSCGVDGKVLDGCLALKLTISFVFKLY
jgi:hypothetical protein